MFTGLIEDIGTVESSNSISRSAIKLCIKKPIAFSDIKVGDSISVNGSCLTVIEVNNDIMVFDVMEESIKCTTISSLKRGDKVNLERSLKIGDRLDGHFVTGHIDFNSEIKIYEKYKENTRIDFYLPNDYRPYIVKKGSVAIDGISLTVGDVFKESFSIHIIPHTLIKTTLAFKKISDTVNVEVDLISKLVIGQKDKTARESVSMDFLKNHGFA